MNPSLLLIPDRYKAAKLYSQIPDSGAGDLTFARNSNATRVNSAGLIEKVRTNVITYSQDFANAIWVKLSMPVTANAGIAPDGTNTADKITPTSSLTQHLIYYDAGTSFNGDFSLSVFVKASGYSKVALRESFTTGIYASFNLTTSTVIDSSPNQTNTITNVGNGWYRISFTASATITANLGIIALPDSYTTGDPFSSFAGDDTSGLLVWGAQLETGVLTPYIPTTTTAVSVGITADIPRLDYTGGGCPSLLLEPQRTNLFNFSEQLDNAYWTKGGTVSANSTASPDGSINADKLVEGTGSVLPIVELVTTLTASTTFTQSVFAKAEGRRYLLIGNNANTSFVIRYCCFDLQTGVVVANNISEGTPKIEAYANGFYRCSISFSNSLNIGRAFQYIYQNAASATPTAYTGDGVSGVSFYGFQLEAGSYVSSYIPTLGSSVTRLADAASKTGISSLIGATEGTLFSEIVVNGFADFGTALCVNNGSTAESIWLTTFANGDIRAEVFSTAGGGVQASFTKSGNAVGQTYKIAIGYAANNFAFFVNGAQVGTTDTSGAVPVGMSRVDFDYVDPASYVRSALKINAAALYTTRLSNSELQSLTAL
jgi:hypothetical protein